MTREHLKHDARIRGEQGWAVLRRREQAHRQDIAWGEFWFYLALIAFVVALGIFAVNLIP